MNKILSIYLLFFLLSINLFASETLVLKPNQDNYTVSSYTEFFIDSTNSLTIKNINELPPKIIFTLNTQKTINLGVNKNTTWFKFNLKNESNIDDWIFEIGYPTLDDVQLYILEDVDKIDTLIQFDNNSQTEKSNINTYSIVHKINFRKDVNYTVVIRVITNSFIILPVTIQSFQSFLKSDRRKNSGLYAWYGVLLALIIFNLILFILTREISYLIFICYLFILSLNSHYLYGYGLDLTANLSPFLEIRMKQLLFGLGSILFLLFSIFYLELKKYKRILVVYYFLISLGTLFTASLFIKSIPSTFYTSASPILFIFGAITAFISGYLAYMNGKRLALYYIISFSAVVIASIIYFLTLKNFIPFTETGFNINLYGTVLFGILITIGLTEKVTAIKQEKFKLLLAEKNNTQLENDIVQRKKIVSELRESEERFRLLFELEPLAISITELETGKILNINHKMEELSGYSRNELIGKTILELNTLDKEERLDILDLIKTQNRIDGKGILINTKDNRTLRCLLYSIKETIQGKTVLLSIISELTEFLEQQEKLNLLYSALSQSANAVVITNTDGEIEYVNSSTINLTGYSREELLGAKTSLFKGTLNPIEFYTDLWDTILRGEKWTGEFHNRKKNGEYFWDLTTITPIYNEYGKLHKFIAIKEDITEKKLQQETLKASEEKLRLLNSTKDKFFSIIAHDLMNPFNAILGFTQLLIDSINEQSNETSLQYASIIDQSSQRIYELLQNLLLWSRAQNGKMNFNPVSVGIVELMMNSINVLKNVAAKKGISIELKIDHNEVIFADQNMLNSVLMNLIQNAIKFTNNGGTITIQVTKDKTNYLFCIQDSGIGMDKNLIDNLFKIEQTVTRNGTLGEHGTGLGLIACAEFVHAHNGDIWVESEIGKGSKFYFTIPN